MRGRLFQPCRGGRRGGGGRTGNSLQFVLQIVKNLLVLENELLLNGFLMRKMWVMEVMRKECSLWRDECVSPSSMCHLVCLIKIHLHTVHTDLSLSVLVLTFFCVHGSSSVTLQTVSNTQKNLFRISKI